MPYSISLHQHNFSAWAASRVASVSKCRFRVEDGKHLLESIGFSSSTNSPNWLPDPDQFDSLHRRWRAKVIHNAATKMHLSFSHGIAAKLINVYLKARFVCGGHHDNPKVKTIHPPIDSLLLDELFKCNISELQIEWAKARRIRWSNFDSIQYEKVISCIRIAVGPEEGLWAIEKHWRGYR